VLHWFSKASAFVWEPVVWLAFFFMIGVLLLLIRNERARLWGRRFCMFGVLALGLFSWRGLADQMIASIEGRYAVPTDLAPYTGFVVLGGAMSNGKGRGSHIPPLACAGERVIEPIPLMRDHPHLKLLFVGGDARMIEPPEPEADQVHQLYLRMQVDMSRVLLESKSRNTYENAVFGKTLSGVDTTQQWLLVTSAWHMPRALATFQKAGWNVVPYPVDFHAPADVDLFDFSLKEGVESWRVLMREGLGYAVYKALGRA
jgi:uncharacterized SAM-binding protein YcdF (DUF218 family)